MRCIHETDFLSLSDEQCRAVRAASRLHKLADEHDNVLYVGYGVFNGLVAKALIKAGWFGPRPPAGRWGFSTLEYHRA